MPPIFYLLVMVLSGFEENARAYRAASCGLVATGVRTNNLDNAITLINRTPFGLASSVRTHDMDDLKQRMNRIGKTDIRKFNGYI
ncbi:aldehyde dehydrogenase family protein [Microbulbifer okhotskensis]|uniref:aldehyde dehydrogenase family protein n=1 Tax=Microbulbifer okhotskensis TaxID=2926617 RepID=UPI00359C5116